jgi:hypothetical protein
VTESGPFQDQVVQEEVTTLVSTVSDLASCGHARLVVLEPKYHSSAAFAGSNSITDGPFTYW